MNSVGWESKGPREIKSHQVTRSERLKWASRDGAIRPSIPLKSTIPITTRI